MPTYPVNTHSYKNLKFLNGSLTAHLRTVEGFFWGGGSTWKYFVVGFYIDLRSLICRNIGTAH